MTSRRRRRQLTEDGDTLTFEGDITDYWSPAVVRHWVLHLPGMKPTAFRLYLLLRAMITSSPRGLRRMTVDQLCYLLSEPGEKAVGESTARAAVALLEKLGLVSNPDGERLVTSTGHKGIQTVARKYKVHDMPPDSHVGWSNTWQKLDAYRPDWRDNPVMPPLHTRTETGIVRSETSGRADQQGPPTLEDERPFERSFSSSAAQKTSSAPQKTSGGEDVTWGNAGGITSPITSSLSGDPSVTPEPSASPEAGTAERETASRTDNRHPAPVAASPSPEAQAHQQDQEQPATAVPSPAAVEAVLAGWAAGAGVKAPPRTVRAQLAGQVAELVASYPMTEELQAIATFCGEKSWYDLGRGATYPECRKRIGQARRAAGHTTTDGRERCPTHPTRYRNGCAPCALAVPA
ncbi:hypothetical protein [Streptomyces virginiae]|uniref:hypothetical protein n=1 Tax=Streptomyces virginiae TaxID=1961 RepID=UPI003650C24F